MRLRQLLVVIDPTQEAQPALQRAAWVACQSGAALELLLVEFNTALEGNRLLATQTQDKARETLLASLAQRVEALARPLREEGLAVSVQVRWGRPLYQEILARVEALQPDLLFKAAGHHSLIRQLLLGNTCWQLIRHCRVPLWLVQQGDWQGQRLCAALDPVHEHDSPAALDHLLVQTARELGSQLGLDAHYLHSHAALPHSLLFDAELVADYDRYVAQSADLHQGAFALLLRPYAIDTEHRHLLQGFAEETLPRFVREQRIDLLVMGAVARGRVHDALIGHTAERVLEAVDCDLLVLKPAAAGPAEGSAAEQ
ncbi:MAG: universal stress protein [Pseudomonas sp.]|uniref:universal stress protein n=1 Tax=Pseudomonas sp. TaxID=306 RepID=UPI0033923C1F